MMQYYNYGKSTGKIRNINRMLYSMTKREGANKGGSEDLLLQEVIHSDTGEVALAWPVEGKITLNDPKLVLPFVNMLGIKDKKHKIEYVNKIYSCLGLDVSIAEIYPHESYLLLEDMIKDGWFPSDEDGD